MKKIQLSRSTLIFIGVIAVLSAFSIGLLIYIRNQVAPIRGVTPITQVAQREPDSSKWGVNFPNQYSSLLKTKTNNTRTTFGGSEPVDKLKVDPRLLRLFAGNAFSLGYSEDRGHMHSLEDVRGTPRLNSSTPGTCYSCKSADNPKLWAEMGMEKYDKTPFSALGQSITQPIGCANCHEANTMKLMVTNPALEEALKAQGKDWRTFTRQEMRTVVCANCHVEYYFVGESKLLTFPWKNGTKIEEIEKVYQENKFVDWTHKDSGTPMIKMQHPDYELFTADSTHYKAGVSCADCHMPYTRDGAVKYSNHDVKSPLIDNGRACAACHTNVQYVLERVTNIQKQVSDTMLATEDALVDAIDAIKLAGENPNVDKAKLDTARDLHRRAQLRWDFIAAENSMGFHNPEEALRILASSTDLARQAQIIALSANK
ncbi:MAG TPA: ammonia-forming cytochrome c nitrite reductase subunit c552 [Anaerolineaceae bacterium]